FKISNIAASGIAPGARVNQAAGGATDQDVTLNATATIKTANLAGLSSALSLPLTPTQTENSGGGYYNGLFAENYARAYIDDRAHLKAQRDVLIHSLTDTE